MPCLSSNAESALNESIRVSNAESQLALPLMTTTVFGVSVISSPNGSAVWTGAAAAGGVGGVSAVAGGVPGAAGELAPGAGVAGCAGAGVADGAGAGGVGVLTAGGAEGRGWARTVARPSQIAAARARAALAGRKKPQPWLPHEFV